jgi:ATP-dependent helicase/nuclease subunit B
MSHNAQRLARDAYLLDAILASRPTEKVQISFSKYNSDGDPNRPSRLLFRTETSELPNRVQKLTSAGPSKSSRARRDTKWRWQLPGDIPKIKSISPTQFENYLECPFRFCFRKALSLDSGPEAAREMDAAVFGNLIHYTLESYALSIIPTGEKMLQLDEACIRKEVQKLLQKEALRQFGPQPAPAVRVQIANAEARLNAFAREQAQCFADGWIILEAERKLKAYGDDPLCIGSLRLSGIIDRIEQHAESGQLRVMDYKTFSSLKKPSDTHFAPISHNWLSEALVEVQQKRGLKEKTWKNLQLPLYRRILEHWYPEESKTLTPTTAYFILPSDPNESGIYPFEEMDDTNNPELYQSALNCAEAVAAHITRGLYWPPQPFRGSWDDTIAPILVNGSPEECISAESIELLKGASE